MNIKKLVMKYGVEGNRAEQLANAILNEVVAPRYDPRKPLFKCERCGAFWHDSGPDSICYNCRKLVNLKDEIA